MADLLESRAPHRAARPLHLDDEPDTQPVAQRLDEPVDQSVDETAPTPRFAFVIATLNGARTVGPTVTTCARQADTYVVSDGSTDDTVGVALAAGATQAVQLDENVGKPAAIHTVVDRLDLLERYDLICIVDDDTIVDDDFVAVTAAQFAPDVAVVCAKTRSDWTHAQRWNAVVAGRAFAYWKYQAFVRRGQSALGVMNCISGSNSVYRTGFLREVLRPDTPYVVDDTYWVLEAHRRRLGRVVYCPHTSARIQEPTTVRSWYKQNLRWLWGTFQGVIGHRVGRRWSRFDLAYLGMMLDWLIYVLFSPMVLTVIILLNRHDADRLKHIALVYAAGYALWSTFGAIALRKWRLVLLWPALIALDWISRVNFAHAAIKAIRRPTAECRWESPARYATAA